MLCTRPLPLVLCLTFCNAALSAQNAVAQTSSPSRITLAHVRRALSRAPKVSAVHDLNGDLICLEKPLLFLAHLTQEHEALHTAFYDFVIALITLPEGDSRHELAHKALKQFVGVLLQTLPEHAENAQLQAQTKRALRAIYQHYTAPRVETRSAVAPQKQSSHKLLVGLAVGAGVVAVISLCYIAWQYHQKKSTPATAHATVTEQVPAQLAPQSVTAVPPTPAFSAQPPQPQTPSVHEAPQPSPAPPVTAAPAPAFTGPDSVAPSPAHDQSPGLMSPPSLSRNPAMTSVAMTPGGSPSAPAGQSTALPEPGTPGFMTPAPAGSFYPPKPSPYVAPGSAQPRFGARGTRPGQADRVNVSGYDWDPRDDDPSGEGWEQ